MKTEPNDTVHQAIGEGLTKREHMAIEFLKALMSNGHHGYDGKQMTTLAIQAADLLIKQLNAEQQ